MRVQVSIDQTVMKSSYLENENSNLSYLESKDRKKINAWHMHFDYYSRKSWMDE